MAGINGKKGIFVPIGDERMADKPLAFRVPQDVFDCLSQLPNKSEWARNLIVSTVRRELMAQSQESPVMVSDTKPVMETTVPSIPKRRGRKPKGES